MGTIMSYMVGSELYIYGAPHFADDCLSHHCRSARNVLLTGIRETPGVPD